MEEEGGKMLQQHLAKRLLSIHKNRARNITNLHIKSLLVPQDHQIAQFHSSLSFSAL